ncbi:uroplakin-3b-like [Rhinophrynus dorsalis]
MDLCGKLFLLIATSAVTFADVPFYVPQITLKPILAKLTTSSFVLEHPQCIFQQYNTSDVWVVVALNSVVPWINYTMLSNPTNISSFKTNGFYHTLRASGAGYPCADTSGKLTAMLQVGSDVNCTESLYCNGPVPSLGKYRVKFVVLNSTAMVTETRWSEVITLRSGINYTTITVHSRRSGGMIAITILLSVLLTILLTCLIAALVVGSKDICWCKKLENKEPKELFAFDNKTLTYKSHPIYSLHNRHPYLKMPENVVDQKTK